MAVPRPMPAPRGLHPDYLACDALDAIGWTDVLGLATFGREPPTPASMPVPVAHVPLPVLAGPGNVCEVWRAATPAPAVSFGQGPMSLRRNGELLFGCVALEEIAPARAAGPGNPALHQATAAAYTGICAALDAAGYPYLLRVWNYVADINGTAGGTERYREFNTARQHALRAGGRPLRGNVPAASALGAAAGTPLLVYFLAGRNSPRYVENPRQVSAYHYPAEYGEHSPSFSRATLLEQEGSLVLFISGTASIVGHRSLHAGDTAAQTRETLANLAALVEAANRTAPGARFSLESLQLKVYVRRPGDLPVIRAELEAALGAAAARALCLQADVCRQELLVEIEAAGRCPLARHA